MPRRAPNCASGVQQRPSRGGDVRLLAAGDTLSGALCRAQGADLSVIGLDVCGSGQREFEGRQHTARAVVWCIPST
eukprot:3151959-Prymnesium_polylepis.1